MAKMFKVLILFVVLFAETLCEEYSPETQFSFRSTPGPSPIRQPSREDVILSLLKRRWGYDSKADPRYREEPNQEQGIPQVIDDQKTETPKGVDIQQLRPGIVPRGFRKKNSGVSRRSAPSSGQQNNNYQKRDQNNGYPGYGSQSGEQVAQGRPQEKEKTKLKYFGRNPHLREEYRYQRGRRDDYEYEDDNRDNYYRDSDDRD